ncbi:MAG: hypothetical protein ACK5MK_00725 [Dysgonomonas sp.]
MKKVIYLFIYLISSSIFFFGCSKDDDNSSLKSPEYESISGKYNVLGNSTYSSIELGASGNYIIVKSTASNRSLLEKSNISFSSAFSKKSSVVSNIRKSRSEKDSSDNGVIFGTYTVNEDGSINLEGFGTLVITYNGSSVTNITLTPTNGTAITLNVEKGDTYENSELTNKLCRTWNMVSISEKEYDGTGKLLYDVEGTFNIKKQTWSWNLKVDELGWGEPSDGSYDLSQILFSKSGTYLVYYTDKTALVRNWKWKDKSSNILYYKEIEDADYDEDNWTLLSFSGNRVAFSEKYSDSEGRWESSTVLEAAD